MELTKNICFAKGESAVDLTRVIRGEKKFCWGDKKLNDHEKSDWPKTMNSEAELQVREANLVTRVSGKLSILQ